MSNPKYQLSKTTYSSINDCLLAFLLHLKVTHKGYLADLTKLHSTCSLIEDTLTKEFLLDKVNGLLEYFETAEDKDLSYVQEYINSLYGDLQSFEIFGTHKENDKITLVEAATEALSQEEEQETNDYAETPVVVHFLDNAEELIEKFGSYKDKILAPSDKDYRIGKFPIIPRSSPIFSLEDYTNLNIEAEQLSLYTILPNQYVIAVKKPYHVNFSYAGMKEEIQLALEEKLSTCREELAEAKFYYRAYKAETEKLKKEYDELCISFSQKLSILGTDTQTLNNIEDKKSRQYKSLRDKIARNKKALSKLEEEKLSAYEKYTLSSTQYDDEYYPKETYLGNVAKVKQALLDLQNNVMTDYIRSVWRVVERKLKKRIDEEYNSEYNAEETLSEAIKALNKKTGDKFVIACEKKALYRGTNYSYYWVLPEKQFNKIVDSKQGRFSRGTSYTGFIEWGFAF